MGMESNGVEKRSEMARLIYTKCQVGKTNGVLVVARDGWTNEKDPRGDVDG